MGTCIIEGGGGGTNSSPKGYAVGLGAGTTFDVSGFTGYHNFTEANFIITSVVVTASCGTASNSASQGSISSSDSAFLSMKYNQSTGVLTISGLNGNRFESEAVATDSDFMCSSIVTFLPYVSLITENPLPSSIVGTTATATDSRNTGYRPNGTPITVDSGNAVARGSANAKAVATLKTDGTIDLKVYSKGSVSVYAHTGDGSDSPEVTQTFGDVNEVY